MTAVHNTKSSLSRKSGECDYFCGDGVWLNSQTRDGATVVAATGELDASNNHCLTNYVQARLSGASSLVLDLSHLSFFGAQGIHSLFEIADKCQADRTEWVLVPGREVTRLLRICDKQTRLPTEESIDEALERFSAPSRARRLFQLVTKSG